ncbi:hypothetical protein PS15p_204457 [Mucor circinelloides]
MSVLLHKLVNTIFCVKNERIISSYSAPSYCLEDSHRLTLGKMIVILQKVAAEEYGGPRQHQALRQMSKKIPKNNKWRLVAEILAAIEKQQQDLYASDCRTKVKNKKLLLDLGNRGFFAIVAQKIVESSRPLRSCFKFPFFGHYFARN